MANIVDLGHCLFHDAMSGLQLQFMAEAVLRFANFTETAGDMRNFMILTELRSLFWIREAPRLVFSLFVRGPGATGSSIVSIMKKAVSLSSVWSDLGFEIRFSETDDPPDITCPSEYCLEFILIRSNNIAIQSPRGLPSILQNPPDTFPPLDKPAVSLAQVHIHLEYIYSPQPVQDDGLFACFDSPGDFYHPLNAPDNPTESMLSLLDIGLQKLILGSTSKPLHIQVLGEDTLASLAAYAPSIFRQGYLDAMNQRALLMPRVADAMTSVLGSVSPSHKAALETSLWHVAQTGLLKTSAPRKTRFLADVSMPDTDSDMMDMDVDWEEVLLSEPIPEPEDESDDQLFDSRSEASFEQICESPETSQDSLCLEYFPLIGSSIDPAPAEDMLLIGDN